MLNKKILAINAMRIRSGGAVAHLIGIVKFINIQRLGFDFIYVYGNQEVLKRLPKRDDLKLIFVTATRKNIIFQLFWEFYIFPKELERINCLMLFNIDAGSICRYHPFVTLSQDMLSYEYGEMRRFRWSRAWLRLLILRYVQNSSFRSADGVIFLTKHAAKVIQTYTGSLKSYIIIPHGVDEVFRDIKHAKRTNKKEKISCLYVSDVSLYKHQDKVVEAIFQLKMKGVDIFLNLVGGGDFHMLARLQKRIDSLNLNNSHIKIHPFVSQDSLLNFMSNSDIFLFASSCENMPVTLLEGMAANLPIACSDRGPMREVLKDGGVYFNPELPETISSAILQLVNNPKICTEYAQKASIYSLDYSWQRCSRETFSYISKIQLANPLSIEEKAGK